MAKASKSTARSALSGRYVSVSSVERQAARLRVKVDTKLNTQTSATIKAVSEAKPR